MKKISVQGDMKGDSIAQPPKKIFLALLPYAVSVLAIFLAWEIMARAVNSSLILPAPKEVWGTLTDIAATKKFWTAVLATSRRVAFSFALSVICGTAVGVLCGLCGFAKKMFELPFAIARSVPVVAFILTAVFWFSSNTIPVFVSAVLTMPIVATSVQAGFSSADSDLHEMAAVFCLINKQKLKYILLPNIMPFFFGGCLSAFGLSWKVVIAGEIISLPQQGVGTVMHSAQVHLESREVLAVTASVVAICFFSEKIFSAAVRLAKGSQKKQGVPNNNRSRI